MSPSGRPLYRSYLLRIWQEADAGQWRGSLHSVQDDTPLYFASLEALAVFLLEGTGPAVSAKSGDVRSEESEKLKR